eukprot:CAMPEP_0118642224 /NCGR_PEP_ID=MMETSP0785-20121206/5723_1 /TAXON_ID=91992 /ORGANISM="Bolidomonas pacifica, Strain CCMP 1866" /LENGTH=129 /DNA_ID=CAMNT_0006533765 /DNA_START=855 /DNA_END=1240 /DNA_ORIENTATION=+
MNWFCLNAFPADPFVAPFLTRAVPVLCITPPVAAGGTIGECPLPPPPTSDAEKSPSLLLSTGAKPPEGAGIIGGGSESRVLLVLFPPPEMLNLWLMRRAMLPKEFLLFPGLSPPSLLISAIPPSPILST